MHVYIGADHRGFALKEKLKTWLSGQGFDVTDCGNTILDETDDYPDIAFAVADGVAAEPGSLGVILCGSGGGVTFAANKVRGIRAGQGINPEDVAHNRDHNDMNILTLGSDFVTEEEARTMIRAFLTTPYGKADRFVRRLAKISARER